MNNNISIIILCLLLIFFLIAFNYNNESFNTYWNSVKDQYKGDTGPMGQPGNDYDNSISDNKKAIIDGFINDLHLNKNGKYYLNNIQLSSSLIDHDTSSNKSTLKFHDFSSDDTLNKLELFLSQLDKKDGVYYINNNPIKCDDSL